jgi:hypothetical protein
VPPAGYTIRVNRRQFSQNLIALGSATRLGAAQPQTSPDSYEEPARKLPARSFDVVVAGAGTAGVVAALAAARQGARTALLEAKGYPGGTVVEGGTCLHSFFNLWKAFPGVQKRQVVRGIPQEIIDRLARDGGTSGHAEAQIGYDYDSVCTAIDTEIYKRVVFEMLDEAGVYVAVNTLLTAAVRDGGRLRGVIAESHAGREALWAKAFVDTTGWGDLAARAGAKFAEQNDHGAVNAMGLANVNVERYFEFFKSRDAVTQYVEGQRDGRSAIIRLDGRTNGLPAEFRDGLKQNGVSMTMTTVHDNYFMFIKIGLNLPACATSRDVVAKGELEVRKRQARAVELFRKYVPGCEKAFIARTSPTLNIRRARTIACDYDISRADVLEGRHFDDDVMAYGFHDNAPRLKIANGGTYGIPYKALRVAGIENLLAAGMMITSDHDAHMSTRNTVACMGQGQAAGTAAALCAAKNLGTRELAYADLRKALLGAGVHLES